MGSTKTTETEKTAGCDEHQTDRPAAGGRTRDSICRKTEAMVIVGCSDAKSGK